MKNAEPELLNTPSLYQQLHTLAAVTFSRVTRTDTEFPFCLSDWATVLKATHSDENAQFCFSKILR